MNRVEVVIRTKDGSTYSYHYTVDDLSSMDAHFAPWRRLLEVLCVPPAELSRLVLADPDDLK